LLVGLAILQLCVVGVPEARADYGKQYGAVVCRGAAFLVRFTYAANEERPEFDRNPPVGAALANLRIVDPGGCRLADGREIVLRHASLRDALAYGACGGDHSELFSLWIGGRKVYSRELQRGKCDQPHAVVAIYYDGSRLTECRRIPEGTPKVTSRRLCVDASARLTRAATEQGQPGKLALVRSATGQGAFCRGLVHVNPTEQERDRWYPGYWPWSARARWPVWTAHPHRRPADVETLRKVAAAGFDLDNDGRRDQVLWVQQDAGFFDGSFWVVLPSPASTERAKALASELREDPETAIPRARSAGAKVYAGDQTAYRNPRYVRLTPFFKCGRTWLHAQWATTRFDLPSELVLEPRPSGDLRTMCEFKALPDL
jgi:hypothetical protein